MRRYILTFVGNTYKHRRAYWHVVRMTLKANTASANLHSLAAEALRPPKTGARGVALAVAVELALGSCATVPGETVTSWRLKREVSDRVLSQASSAAPQCTQQKITNTEIVELHPDGKPSAERWTLDQCGRRRHYLVYFPPTGRGAGFSVQAEK